MTHDRGALSTDDIRLHGNLSENVEVDSQHEVCSEPLDVATKRTKGGVG